MLVISEEQMEAMSVYMSEQFEDRMIARMRTRFPEQTGALSDDDLRSRIRAGLDKAEGYHVTDQHDVERYLDCDVMYGSDFDTNPKSSWAGEILRDNTLDGTQKMDRIDNYALFVLKGQ